MKAPILCAAMLVVPPAHASELDAVMRDYVETQVAGWLSDPVILRAVRTQNALHADLTSADIDALDRQWRDEIGQTRQPTIDSVLKTPASDFLRARQAATAGIVSEIFVMDSRGLNVASSGTTSDYWQGDEDKFRRTYGQGPDAVHISEVEFDESTQSYLGQVSISLSDPDTGAVIGAVTIGLNAEMLF